MALQRKRGGRKPDIEDLAHSGFYPYLVHFLDRQQTLGLHEDNIKRMRSVLRKFIRWCDERGLNRPQDITLPILERYQRYLYTYRKADGSPLTLTSQVSLTVAVKRFFKWLTRQHHILYNPAADLDLPKAPSTLPRAILSPAEIDAVFNQPDITTPTGIRDRAILETFYASGIRRGELLRLNLHDVNLNYGSLFVREGKNRKDRLVPLGKRAAFWITRYLTDVRPGLLLTLNESRLFLTSHGEPFQSSALANNVKRYLRAAGIDVPGTCHLFRHAMATHMLENGADIRYIQVILGHAKLTTTEIYTRVSIDKLKRVHAATHPLMREHGKQKNVDDEAMSADELLDAIANESDDDADDDTAADGRAHTT